ncbi:MAG: autotransporter outer membrane beta-barrel domain-containing protein [Planctomycetaceae bacterium]|nr:autotransporter outer membrane beta-barrel domain-containing protein [Planctomycetaceae bacterium]
MRNIGGMITLLIMCQFLPSFHMVSCAGTGYEPLFSYQCPEKPWSWDGERDFEILIRGQNRYSRYLRNYGLWGNAYGFDGRLRPKSHDLSMLKNTGSGMQFGIDLPSGDMFSSSFYYSYSTPKFASHVPFFLPKESYDATYAPTDLSSTSHHFGLRWTSYGEGLYMQFGVNGGFDKHRFHIDGANVFDGNGWQFGGNSEVGLDILLGTWKVRPHLGLDYRWLYHDDLNYRISSRFLPFDEFDGFDGINIAGNSYNALYSNLGVRAFQPLGPILEWQTRLSWLHNYLKNAPIRVQRYGAVPGTASPTQLFLDGSIGCDWLWFGTGLKLHFGSFFNFFVDYDLIFNKYETTHCGSVKLLLSW